MVMQSGVRGTHEQESARGAYQVLGHAAPAQPSGASDQYRHGSEVSMSIMQHIGPRVMVAVPRVMVAVPMVMVAVVMPILGCYDSIYQQRQTEEGRVFI